MAKANRHKDRGRAPEQALQQKNRHHEPREFDNSKSASVTQTSIYSQPGLGVVAIVTGVLLAFALWKGLTVLDDVALAHTSTANNKSLRESAFTKIPANQPYQANYDISSHTVVASLVKDLPLQDWNISGLDLEQPANNSTHLNIPQASVSFSWQSPYGEKSSIQRAFVVKNDTALSEPRVISETTTVRVTELIEEFERTQSISTIKKLFDHWKQNSTDQELMALWTGFLNQQGDIFVVESLYSQAHKSAPRNLLLHRQWARYYYDREEYNIASTILARIYTQAVSSEDIETLHLYAAAEAKLGSVFLAEEIYRHLARMQPSEWRWVLALATVFDEAQDNTNSQVFYQQLLGYNNLPPEVESLVQKKLVVSQGY